ncbi:MAG: helix-turn-helix domain-containing protein [Firmicutes bacterium]|nr:helix-turn-helix domain-containing protein [Bacillota bacterium]
MTFGDRLKNLRKKKRLTLGDLEERFDRGKTAFSNYENDIRKPNMHLMTELADFFDVSVDYLLGREELVKEEPEKLELVPIVDISMGQAILKSDNIVGYKKVDKESVEGGEYFYLRITGDESMINSGIKDRDLVLIRKQDEIKDGDIALVTLQNKVSLKYLYSIKDHFVLQADNPKYKPIIIDHGEIKIIGKAIEVIRRL